tara:strand:+ start:46 stop:282 length:237 start_codon:yes stop_codon:yes gene_type:complete
MTQFIRGNYDLPDKSVENQTTDKADGNDEESKPTPQQEFERKALAKLGGSIAFIAKPTMVWNGDNEGDANGKPGDTDT